MKVYVHYEEGSDAELHVTLKLTLPKKWNDESPVKLLKVKTTKQATRVPFAGCSGDCCCLGKSSRRGEIQRPRTTEKARGQTACVGVTLACCCG